MSKRIPPQPPEPDRGRVVERPDGFYWQDPVDGRLYGPFRSAQAALDDMQNEDTDGEFEEGESLAEAEAEIGITDWIDPDTGMPAEEVTSRYVDE